MGTNLFIETIGYVLPALVVFITVYFMLSKYFENEQRRRMHEIKSESLKLTLPIRLQAYERLALLMERLTVNNLVLRVKRSGMSAQELQGGLLTEIRLEFEHNLSQQIYVTHETWQMVNNAKDELVRLINASASTLVDGADGLALTKTIFEMAMKMEIQPTYRALLYINKEAQELF